MKSALNKSINTLTLPDNYLVGNDLIFLPNFEQSFTAEFKLKVYTPLEVSYCELFSDNLLRYASTWAAKEAVYKAIKQHSKAALNWRNIEIVREKIAGKPEVKINGNSDTFNFSLSISHDGDYVWAIAILKR